MIGRTLAGRYYIVKKLGNGAFGQTYLAEDTQTPDKKRCVVKQLKPIQEDEFTLREAKRLFKREAEVLSKLGDENSQIPRLLAYFEEDREFYLVQEFIEGNDLSTEIAVGKILEEAEVIQILDELLDILSFVHQQKTIHRDIKPSNIMRRKKDGKLVLIDFGAVKELSTQIVSERGLTSLTIAIGTPGYMPSEQSQSRPKFASDIYALGMMAIFALTGINPDNFPKNHETESIIWRDKAQVSNELRNFIDTMVKYHFRERYTSAIEVKQALKQLLSKKKSDILDSTFITPKSKKTKIIAIPVILIIALAGGGYYWLNKSQPVPIVYENSEYAIQLKYIDNWRVVPRKTLFEPLAKFYPPEKKVKDTSVEVHFDIVNLPPGTSLEQFTNKTISKIIEFPEAKIIDSRRIELKDKIAHRVVYTRKDSSGDFISKHLQIWFLEANKAYLLVYSAPEARYDDFVTTVEDTMIPSLVVED